MGTELTFQFKIAKPASQAKCVGKTSVEKNNLRTNALLITFLILLKEINPMFHFSRLTALSHFLSFLTY